MEEDLIKPIYKAFRNSAGVVTDSRKSVRDFLFFALKGENFDGNDFATAALENGASFAVVSADSAVGKDILSGKDIPMRNRYFVVKDTLIALQSLALYHRLHFKIPVIALTGTNGKTTTKELICAILSTKFEVTATVGNLNNHIGVPMTLLRLTPETEIAVIEMGANHIGEIECLTSIALPDLGLITNVGIAHIEGFGSYEGVKKAKGELYDFLQKSGGTALYNVDSENLRTMVKMRPNLHTMKYGIDYQGADILPVCAKKPFLRMMIPLRLELDHSCEEKNAKMLLETHLTGNYNAENVLSALNVGKYFGVPLVDAVSAVAAYIPSNNRSQLVDTGKNILVLDAYNANPSSMRASLLAFDKSKFERKMLILGDMLELGKNSAEEHLKVIEQVFKMNFIKCFFVGEEFFKIGKNVSAENRFEFFRNTEELRERLINSMPEGYSFLIKGSNGINLLSVKDAL